jgi:hypothetical protein
MKSLILTILFTLPILSQTPTLKAPALCPEFESNYAFYDNIRFLPVRFDKYDKTNDTLFGVYVENQKKIILTRELPLVLMKNSKVPENFRSGAHRSGNWALFYIRCKYNDIEQNVLLMAEPITKR